MSLLRGTEPRTSLTVPCIQVRLGIRLMYRGMKTSATESARGQKSSPLSRLQQFLDKIVPFSSAPTARFPNEKTRPQVRLSRFKTRHHALHRVSQPEPGGSPRPSLVIQCVASWRVVSAVSSMLTRMMGPCQETFNEFFYRKLKPEVRPLDDPNDPRTLVSPADVSVVLAGPVSRD